jgi:hypothetical protein
MLLEGTHSSLPSPISNSICRCPHRPLVQVAQPQDGRNSRCSTQTCTGGVQVACTTAMELLPLTSPHFRALQAALVVICVGTSALQPCKADYTTEYTPDYTADTAADYPVGCTLEDDICDPSAPGVRCCDPSHTKLDLAVMAPVYALSRVRHHATA